MPIGANSQKNFNVTSECHADKHDKCGNTWRVLLNNTVSVQSVRCRTAVKSRKYRN